MSLPARAFPAFPRGARRGARTFWGRAWWAAVEEALLDKDLSAAGRRHAVAGRVGVITVTAGRIVATTHDGDPDSPHHTSIDVERLPAGQWSRLLARVSRSAGQVAALLEGAPASELLREAEEAGVRLLPDIGDLDASCGCDQWSHVCVHAVAVCHQMAWLLDEEPMLLLLLRGNDETSLRSGLITQGNQSSGSRVAEVAERARRLLSTYLPGSKDPSG
jgi:uncharacterized Zn finger protein